MRSHDFARLTSARLEGRAMHIVCWLIGHRRDSRSITPWRETWQADCSQCATRLGRVRHGKWVPVRRPEKITSDLPAGKAKAAD